MEGSLVRFVCVAPDHSRANGDPEAGILTIVADAWASCPWGGTGAHVWDETDGVDIRAARTAALRRRGPATRQEGAGATRPAT